MKKISLTIFIVTHFYTFIHAQFTVNWDGTMDLNKKLTVTTTDSKSIISKATHTYDWQQSFRSEVNRANSLSYGVALNGKDKFYVLGTGTIFASGAYYTSDIKISEDLKDIESSLDKIIKLKGVQYRYKKDSVDDGSKEQQIHTGLIAQEVEKILPSAVITNNNGIKAVAYHEIVPLLIEAIKTQQEDINILKTKLEAATLIGSSQTKSETGKSYFGMNTPSQLNKEVILSVHLEKNVTDAKIMITDLQGVSLKLIELNGSGDIDVKISLSFLKPGIYNYFLITDNTPVDSKKIVITK